MHGPGMGRYARIFYFAILALLVILALLAAIAGWWFYTILSAIFAAMFIATGRFVLGKGWRPPAPKPTRRPVVKRRR